MGSWHISIEGLGSHHNPDFPQDANRMAARFVEELKVAGHRIARATFTHGGAEKLGEDGSDFRSVPAVKD